MLQFFQKSEKLLGVDRGRRKYDLPLDKTEGTGFLKVLILMMTILAVMAFAVFFVLSDITKRWTSGLENKATVEIPAQDTDGNAIEQSVIETYLKQSSQILKQKPYVAEAQIMDEADIQKLVAPWLGEDTNLTDIPLPGLISVSFQAGMSADMNALKQELESINPLIRIDTHQSWLNDVLRFAGALQFGSVLLLSIIGVITFSAVAGAVKSRIAVHKDEVELLHLIG
ncbi:MAG: permease, partial [Pseudomonadota bacterium]